MKIQIDKLSTTKNYLAPNYILKFDSRNVSEHPNH